VGRTQEIIYELNKYLECHDDKKSDNRRKFMNIPVYIDSPLATKATEIFKQNANVFDDETRRCILEGDNPLEFENLHFTQSVEESKILNASKEPKIIISASGMCEAGRIKHHLKHHLWKKESSIVFVGYQAEGTLGRKIIDGEKYVKVLGEEIRVNAQIHNVQGFSGHADKNALLDWIRGFEEKPKKVFLVHGEAEAKSSFAAEIKKTLQLSCIIPEYNKVYEIKKQLGVKEIALEEVKETSQRTADKTQIEDLKKELEKIKEIFEKTMANTKYYLEDDKINTEKYKDISNSILALENEILNLSMVSTK